MKRKTKIVFCMNRMIMGGVEKVLCRYLLALSKNTQYELTVVCKKKVTEQFFIDFFLNHKIKLYDSLFCYQNIKQSFIVRLFLFIINRLTWKYLVRKNDIFIDFANCSFIYDLKKINKTKIAWCHGSINFYNQFLKRKLNNNNYNRIVFLSDSIIKDIALNNKTIVDKSLCIYNPIDIALIKQLASNKSLINTNEKYFVAVQRLDNFDKNVSTIIEAFNKFSKKNDNIKMYIIGDGPDKNQLINLAKNNSNIIFTGQISNPFPIIDNAIALILSSTKKIGEGLPNTILEAQALETLVIASDVKSGVRELLLDGKAGILFEAEDSDSLLEKLTYAITNNSECKEKIDNATKAISRFNVNNSIEKIERLFSGEY